MQSLLSLITIITVITFNLPTRNNDWTLLQRKNLHQRLPRRAEGPWDGDLRVGGEEDDGAVWPGGPGGFWIVISRLFSQKFFQLSRANFESYCRDSALMKSLDKNNDGIISELEMTSKHEMAFKVILQLSKETFRQGNAKQNYYYSCFAAFKTWINYIYGMSLIVPFKINGRNLRRWITFSCFMTLLLCYFRVWIGILFFSVVYLVIF